MADLAAADDTVGTLKQKLAKSKAKGKALKAKLKLAQSAGDGSAVAKAAKRLAKWKVKYSALKDSKKAAKAVGTSSAASSKKRRREDGSGGDDAVAVAAPAATTTAKRQRFDEADTTAAEASAPTPATATPAPRTSSSFDRRRGGPTRLFAGNLSFKITADKLRAFLQGNATHIMWLTDKETGRFYGSAFVEMQSADALQSALTLNGNKLMGRPIKLNAAPPRPTDVWPPAEAEVTAGKGGKADAQEDEFAEKGGAPTRSPKPFEECVKIFLGNLSYDVQDENVHKFFSDCGTITQLRWLTSRETGEFRGQGYAEFGSTEEADKAVLLNGKKLLGRKMVIDWAE